MKRDMKVRLAEGFFKDGTDEHFRVDRSQERGRAQRRKKEGIMGKLMFLRSQDL